MGIVRWRVAQLARLGRSSPPLGSSGPCRSLLLVSTLALVTAVIGEAAQGQPALREFRFEQVQMGAPVELVLYAADESTANKAAEAAYARFAELNRIMSDYDPQSELSRLSDTSGQGRPVPLSLALWNVLLVSQDLARRSDGAFDVTVGPYVKLWRRARRSKAFPPADRMAEARQAVGFQFLHLDPANRTALLDRPGMRLDLGGIAMGYACDEAMKTLHQHGIRSALIDASGDILVGDPPPGKRGWTIGVAPLERQNPTATKHVLLAGAAITTSGDAFQHVDISGKRYSHIVDPHTGLGLSTPSSATVIAPHCIDADSLATALSVLGPDKGFALVRSTPGAAAFYARRSANGVESFETKNWGQNIAP